MNKKSIIEPIGKGGACDIEDILPVTWEYDKEMQKQALKYGYNHIMHIMARTISYTLCSILAIFLVLACFDVYLTRLTLLILMCIIELCMFVLVRRPLQVKISVDLIQIGYNVYRIQGSKTAPFRLQQIDLDEGEPLPVMVIVLMKKPFFGGEKDTREVIKLPIQIDHLEKARQIVTILRAIHEPIKFDVDQETGIEKSGIADKLPSSDVNCSLLAKWEVKGPDWQHFIETKFYRDYHNRIHGYRLTLAFGAGLAAMFCYGGTYQFDSWKYFGGAAGMFAMFALIYIHNKNRMKKELDEWYKKSARGPGIVKITPDSFFVNGKECVVQNKGFSGEILTISLQVVEEGAMPVIRHTYKMQGKLGKDRIFEVPIPRDRVEEARRVVEIIKAEHGLK